uniref:Uncharacterized protein n=1 Tax=Arundo donax TaxID=35708 RepID=A0A0A9B799_ARUDO
MFSTCGYWFNILHISCYTLERVVIVLMLLPS